MERYSLTVNSALQIANTGLYRSLLLNRKTTKKGRAASFRIYDDSQSSFPRYRQATAAERGFTAVFDALQFTPQHKIEDTPAQGASDLVILLDGIRRW